MPIRKGDGTGLAAKGFTEVRKGDGTVLSSLPSSAFSQFDAAQIGGLSDGDTVSTWEDRIGTNDASATGSPTYRASQLNGNPAVEYDGSGDYHNTGFMPNTSNNLAVIAAVSFTNENSSALTGSLDSNLDDRFSIPTTSTGEYNPAYGDGAIKVSGGVATGSTLVITLRGTGSTAFIRVNGAQEDSFSYVSGGSSDAAQFLGARNREDGNPIDNFFAGYIGEIVFYEGLTDSGRDSEEQRLADKWGVAL